MNALQRYEDLAANARKRLSAEKRSQTGQVKVRLQMGICSMSVRAREIKEIFEDLGMVVTQTGCAGFCSLEPLVEVEIPGCRPVVYCNITPEKARMIYLNHIKRGMVITPWTLAGKDV